MGTSGLPDMYTRGLRVYISGEPRVHMDNYYVTLSSYANGFTVFIVVLIAFECGLKI